jgi:hypothetical protein
MPSRRMRTRGKVVHLAHKRAKVAAMGAPPAFCHGRCVGVDKYEGRCKCPCGGANHGTYHAHRPEYGESFVDAWAVGFTRRASRLVSRHVKALAEDHRKNKLASPDELRRRHDELRRTMAVVSEMLAIAHGTPKRRAVG